MGIGMDIIATIGIIIWLLGLSYIRLSKSFNPALGRDFFVLSLIIILSLKFGGII